MIQIITKKEITDGNGSQLKRTYPTKYRYSQNSPLRILEILGDPYKNAQLIAEENSNLEDILKNTAKHELKWNEAALISRTLASMASANTFVFNLDDLFAACKTALATKDQCRAIGFLLADIDVLDTEATGQLLRKFVPHYAQILKNNSDNNLRNDTSFEILFNTLKRYQIRSSPSTRSWIAGISYPTLYKIPRLVIENRDIDLLQGELIDELKNPYLEKMRQVLDKIIDKKYKEAYETAKQAKINAVAIATDKKQKLSKDKTAEYDLAIAAAEKCYKEATELAKNNAEYEKIQDEYEKINAVAKTRYEIIKQNLKKLSKDFLEQLFFVKKHIALVPLLFREIAIYFIKFLKAALM